MSLRASASSFVPGQLNPNSRSFVPQMPQSRLPDSLESRRNRSARNIQSRYRGNKSRNLTLRRNKPIDYDVQRKIMNRYILDGEPYEFDDVNSRIDGIEQTNKTREMLRKERLAVENSMYPDRDEKMKRGQEEQGRRNRRVRTNRTLRAMRNVPEGQRQGLFQDYLMGSVDSNSSEDMRIKRQLRDDVDYYNTQKQLDMDEMDPILNDEMIQGNLKQQLQNMKQMDPMRCKRVREMVDADPKLFKDKSFYDMYIKPCKDETTNVYINTFYNIDREWIHPIGKWPSDPRIRTRRLVHGGPGEGRFRYGSDEYISAIGDFYKEKTRFGIEEAINKIPSKYYPHSSKTALIDCLIELELLTTERGGENRIGPPFYNFDALGSFFKLLINGQNDNLRVHIQGRGLSGKEELERLLNLFEETVLSRKLKHPVIIDGIKRSILIDADKIEQMKRYFILMLIGVVGNPTYVEQLRELFDVMLEKYNDEFNVDPRLRETPDGLELYGKLKRLESWMLSVERYFR